MHPTMAQGDTIAADLVVAELVTTAGLADPYARLERIRSIGRAVPSTIGVILTGYDDCQEALRNSALVSDADATFAPLLGDTWRDNRALSLLADSLLFLEGAAHNRVRKLVAAAFTPAAVDGWQATIQQIVDGLLADVAVRLASGEDVDLVEALARPLPIAVMAELLGLPRADATQLQSMIGEVANLNVGLAMGPDDLARAQEVGQALDAYLRKALSVGDVDPRRSDDPARSGVLGRIALDTNDAVSDDDRVSLAFILLAAGFETTAMLVGNALHLLLESPAEWRALAIDPTRAPLVIEETLRLQAPAALTTRFASAPTTVGGVEVPSSTSIAMFLGAANRDPAKFRNPALFDPSRYGDAHAESGVGTGADSPKTTPPLSFGSGLHHCLGSILARSEASAVLRRLAVLGEHDHLVVVRPVEWRPTIALRGVESLVVARPQSTASSQPSSVVAAARQTDLAVASDLVSGRARRRKANRLMGGLVAGFAVSRVKTLFVRGERKQAVKDDYAAQSAAKAVEVMGDLKGVTMKMGQMASFLAPTMSDAAKRSLVALQSSAPPMAAGQSEAVIERALGKRVDELFAEWSPVPVAAASIGQVHWARLHDGREVAVKVQYPGVADAMESDLKDTARMTKLTQRFAMRSIDAETLSRDLSERITQELDFRIEANHQRQFAKRFHDHPFVHIPDVIDELSTKTVLVTTWVEGENWATFLSHGTQAEKDRAGEIIARFMFMSTRRYGHFNADPNPGNFIFDPNAKRITFIDFGLAKKLNAHYDKRMWLLWDSVIDQSTAEEILQGCINGGYLKADHGLDPDLLRRYMTTSSDFYNQHPFTVTPEWYANVMKTVFLFEVGFTSIRTKLTTEADFFMRDRVYWGVLGILAELNATGDWRPMANEYRHNSSPSSPLGELEAIWLQSHPTAPRDSGLLE
jgi:predicted unusual protein kinase regulating ubiquinone biosynthesis (AarF/ABC1/UbiB family)/cytochrome P450